MGARISLLMVSPPNPFAVAVEQILVGAGWDSRIAANAEVAEKMIKNRVPDLLLVNGEENQVAQSFAENILAQRRFAQLPVFFMMPSGTKPYDAWVAPTKKSAYIDRPFGPEMLTDRLRLFYEESQRANYDIISKRRMVDSGSVDKATLVEMLESIQRSQGYYMLMINGQSGFGRIEFEDGQLLGAAVGDVEMNSTDAMRRMMKMEEGFYELHFQPHTWILH